MKSEKSRIHTYAGAPARYSRVCHSIEPLNCLYPLHRSMYRFLYCTDRSRSSRNKQVIYAPSRVRGRQVQRRTFIVIASSSTCQRRAVSGNTSLQYSNHKRFEGQNDIIAVHELTLSTHPILRLELVYDTWSALLI